jgi:HAE1 family hydrophobic/amphiphilic exporter-1
MSISSLSVRRGVTFTVLFIVVLGFGLFSLSRLQLDMFPELSFPSVMILTNYTGASPEDMETLVTRPLEEAVSAVKGVKSVNSESKQGSSVVTVEFDWGKDMEQAETDVRRGLEFFEGMLPNDADDPMVFALDPSMQPVVIFVVSGTYSLDRLRTIAEDEICPRLERIEGIASAEVLGGLKREIHVTLDPAKIEAFNIDINAVLGAIYQENLQEPGGSIEQGAMDFTIQTQGKYQSIEEIGEVVVGVKKSAAGPEPLRLAELADIEDSFMESKRVVEVDGEPSILVTVRKQSGANTVQAATAVVDSLPEITRGTGRQIDFKVMMNQADFINASLGNLSSTAIVAIAITFIVLFFFLRNARSSLIVATAVPLSVIATFFVMDQADMTLNMISMAGLALAVGMLVDNAIVVLENIFRLREEGLGIREAAIRGAGEVGTAITASTLTTVSVFVPVLFVKGIAGQLFRDMAVTICFALAVSLVVAVSFVPLAASRLLKGVTVTSKERTDRQADLMSQLRIRYGRLLDWSLGHRWAVGLGLGILIILTVALAKLLPTDFMAQSDRSDLYVSIETAVGNNLDETTMIAREAKKQIEGVIPEKDRKLIMLDVGTSEGFLALFAKGVYAGSFRIPLVQVGERETSQAEYEQKVRDSLKQIPGLKATTAMPISMTGGEGDLEIEISGHDLTTARKIGLDLKKRLEAMAEIAEVSFSMEEQKPEVLIRFDRRKMADMRLSTASVGRAISTYFKGRIAGRYADGGEEFDILVRFAREHRLDIDELRRMPVATSGGTVVRLSSIADLAVGLGPVSISRLNQERVTKLTCTLKNKYQDQSGRSFRKDLGGSIGRIEEVLGAFSWPEGFTYHVGGTAEDFQSSFASLGLALLVSVLLVYLVMASLFESLREPFIIIFTVPLAGIGVVLMFILTGSAMDVSAMIGVIMLVGIVVNNGIIMIDAANQLRTSGLDRLEAIAEASRLRLRPVLLTSLTTMLSMVPLAMEIGEGASNWSGMAKSVIGGLTLATALTLIVVPTMYTLFASKSGRQPTEEETT